MPTQHNDPDREPAAWLVHRSGPRAGVRHRLRAVVTRIGRDPRGDIVLSGDEASVVSSRHLEIRHADGNYRLRDLGSTNGTFLDGERIGEAVLEAGAVIRFGKEGPEFVLELAEAAAWDLEQTLAFPPDRRTQTQGAGGGDDDDKNEGDKKQDPAGDHEELLDEAVEQAREARRRGHSDQTAVIMRRMLGVAVDRSTKKSKAAIAGLVIALCAVTALGYWSVERARKEKSALDQRIQQIEEKFTAGGLEEGEIEALIAELEDFQSQARTLQTGLLYRWGVLDKEQLFIQKEIRMIMKEFGAESYSIPPEFIQQVERFIERYQTRDRAHLRRTLGRSRNDLAMMRKIFAERKLPPDLAYIVVVESAFLTGSTSSAGAAGPWQFQAATARQYGLTVSGEVDERYDLAKSTHAASRYIRELILDFGSGSSVMLALAAYNLGPGRVKRAVRKVDDPIKQRNFWYLYRVRTLPAETREYIPKIIAAIIIGRNPEQFGFAS